MRRCPARHIRTLQHISRHNDWCVPLQCSLFHVIQAIEKRDKSHVGTELPPGNFRFLKKRIVNALRISWFSHCFHLFPTDLCDEPKRICPGKLFIAKMTVCIQLFPHGNDGNPSDEPPGGFHRRQGFPNFRHNGCGIHLHTIFGKHRIGKFSCRRSWSRKCW